MSTSTVTRPDRIAAKFAAIKAEDRPGLVVFVTVGHPYKNAALDVVPRLVAAGADAVELGMPFSDPVGEGPVIQASSYVALQNGVTTQDCLDTAAALRTQIGDTPLILMGLLQPGHGLWSPEVRRRVLRGNRRWPDHRRSPQFGGRCPGVRARPLRRAPDSFAGPDQY